MALELQKEVLAEFRAITSCNIEEILTDATNFLVGPYNRIVSYYSGEKTKVSQADFNLFDEVERKVEVAFSVFRTQSNAFNNLKWWLLLDILEQIDSRLKSLRKINKWSKSSQTSFAFVPTQQAFYTNKQHQTLERVAQDVLKKRNPTDDWFDIAIANKLEEEDYTSEGGTSMLLSFPSINNGIDISAVVDTMVGDNILGKDLDRDLRFENDDLKVLSTTETVQQSVEILAGLRKNDNPDFPDQGLQSSIVIGGNRASLNFPIITRQYIETFASDDSLKNFQLLSLQVVEDGLEIKFQIQTRLNETIDHQIVV